MYRKLLTFQVYIYCNLEDNNINIRRHPKLEVEVKRCSLKQFIVLDMTFAS